VILFRFLVLAILTVLAGSVLFYFFTKDRRYLRFAGQVLRFGLVFSFIFAAILFLERLVLR
jgi:Na+-driven multidrug efflux pump